MRIQFVRLPLIIVCTIHTNSSRMQSKIGERTIIWSKKSNGVTAFKFHSNWFKITVSHSLIFKIILSINWPKVMSSIFAWYNLYNLTLPKFRQLQYEVLSTVQILRVKQSLSYLFWMPTIDMLPLMGYYYVLA